MNTNMNKQNERSAEELRAIAERDLRRNLEACGQPAEWVENIISRAFEPKPSKIECLLKIIKEEEADANRILDICISTDAPQGEIGLQRGRAHAFAYMKRVVDQLIAN